MDDKPLVDSNLFDALAFGVFESATDVDSGRAALLQAYDKYQWDKPEKAQEVLEYYGQALKFKNSDQSSFGADIEKIAPVKLTDIPLEGLENDQALYTKWEEANAEYLKTTKEPQYLVAKKQLEEDVKNHASAQRRAANTAQLKSGIEKDLEASGISSQGVKDFVSGALDFNTRAIQAGLAGVEPVINYVLNKTFTDGYELNSHITEFTDPDQNATVAAIASGYGSTVGALAAGGAAGKAGVAAYSGVQAVDAVNTRYQDTLKKTGDQSEANKALALETASQAVQLVGENLVFGKIADRALGEAGSTVLKAAGTEAAAEGTGQVLSNAAENVETARPVGENLGRNVPTSLVLGGVFAGGAQSLSNKFPSKRNNTDRSTEINDTGFPITPVTTQKLGAVYPTEIDTGDEDIIPADSSAIDLTSEEDVAEDVAPAQPIFETEDGAQYMQGPSGQAVKENALPHDTTVYLSDSQAKMAAKAIQEGNHIIIQEDGTPVIEQSDEAGAPINYQTLTFSNEPSTGSYPLNISRERSPSSQEKVRAVELGQRIKTVYPDRSIGAASANTEGITQRESTYSRKLRESATVNPALRDLGNEGIFYTPIDQPTVNSETNSFVKSAGINGAIKALSDPSINPVLSSGIGTYLHNYFNAKLDEAMANDDTESLFRLQQDIQDVIPTISADLTKKAQALALSKGKVGLSPLRVAQASAKAYNEAVIAAAEEEGVDPLEVGNSTKNLEVVTKAVDAQKAVVDKESANPEVPSEEVAAIDEVIADIEATAQAKVDEDLSTIDAETEDLTKAIETTEKKATRSKRKAEQALEEAVAKDSVELVNALADAQEIKTATTEETATLEAEVDTQLKAAESKTNTEVKAAVAAERKQQEQIKKTALERAGLAVSKAQAALGKLKADSQQRLIKLNGQKKLLEKANQSTADVDTRIAAIETRITKAAQRAADAKVELTNVEEQVSAESDAAKELEDTLQELESGVEIKISPVGKKRSISVTTKRSGLNVTKLFNSKSEAAGPLAALSRNVNDLANVLRQGKNVKAANNDRISALQKRINENSAALKKTRESDTLSAVEKKKIAAAKKRLADLEKAKADTTLDNLIPAKQKKKYQDLKARKAALGDKAKRKNPALEAAEKKLRDLQKEQAKQARLAEKKTRAKQAGLQAAKQQSDIEKKIGQLQTILLDKSLPKTFKDKIEAEIQVLSGVNEVLPERRDSFYKLWVAAQIGSMLGITVGTVSSLAIAPVAKSLGLINSTGLAFINNVVAGKNKYKYPLMEYWAGLISPTALKRGVDLAGVAWRTGDRLQNIIDRKELVARSDIKAKPTQYQDVAKDYINFTKELEFKPAKEVLQNLEVLAHKIAGRSSGLLLRALAATEAVTYGLHDNGFDRATSAYYYNKNLSGDVDSATLQKYQFNGKENWKLSQAAAADKAKLLRDAGIDITPGQEKIAAVEHYQGLRPKEVQISTFKNAAQVVLNAPAAGYTGLFTDYLQKFVGNLEGVPVVSGIKYLVPFANSIANQLGMAADLTPLAGLGLLGNQTANRTSFERSMMISSSITGTATAMGLGLLAIKNLELPEDERPFDIIGMYSSDKKKRDAFVQGGGLLYSIRLGNKYYPFSETPFVLLFGGVATAVDQARDGKEPVPENAAAFSQAAFSMAFGSLGSVGQISMLRGVTDISEAVTDYFKGTQGADIKIARTLSNTVKGFIPGASLLRNLARYTDNPVDAKKDIVSALVEGIPALQSAYGKPALNIFGEPMPAGRDNDTLKLHRIFSSKASDLDVRWLTDNGYTIPALGNMQWDKRIQNMVAEGDGEGAAKLDYNLKYNVFKNASGEIRDKVAEFRSYFGGSAYDPKVQKNLNAAINKILARHKVLTVTGEE